MLQISAGWAQTVGKRDYQQDGVTKLVWPNGFALTVLSDGMGGAVHGEVASQEILRAFNDAFCDSEEEQMDVRLQQSLDATNQHLANYITQNPECNGMGGTLIAAAFTGEYLDFLSVGDSPLWLCRGNALQRINKDHSKKSELMQLVEEGVMTEQDVAVHPQRNQLTSAVMGYDVDMVDINSIALQSGDIVLLASDGIESIPEQDIATMCHRFYQSDPQVLAEHIVGYVDSLDKDYQDNATVMVLKVAQESDSEELTE
ncbi:phosphatase [Aliiglaciecola lipolytica E3]|uniref:Phosphatase n=2 Tax=Aliiglaciecola TaxID=1406885 RepID=K6WWD3_9ALTE|nr:phosphatase [Aliiglaciecola lipolytica E3]